MASQPNNTLEERRRKLNDDLRRLEERLPTTSGIEHASVVAEIKRVQRGLDELDVDQRNRMSMDGGSEA